MVAACVFSVFVIFLYVSAARGARRAREAALKSLSGFTATKMVMGDDGLTGLAMDEDRQLICLISSDLLSPGPRLEVISPEDVLSAEVFEDGDSVTRVSRAGQAGGALLGGVALGGVGAIVGGLSAKQVSSDRARRIELRLTVNRMDAPVHDIVFLRHETKKGGFVYNTSMKQARHWQGMLEVMLKRLDVPTTVPGAERAVGSLGLHHHVEIADELAKLAALKRDGTLTDSEFTDLKKRLLSN